MKKKDRLIKNLREIMTANAPGQSGGFTSSSSSEGPTAGFDPLLYYKKTKKDKIDQRSVPAPHRRWLRTVKEFINT